jgi:hypothetical protein
MCERVRDVRLRPVKIISRDRLRERENAGQPVLAEIALGVMNQFARSVGQSEGCLGQIDRTPTAPIAAATRPRVLPAVIQKPISA